MKLWLKIFYWMLIIFTLYILFEVLRKVLGGILRFEVLIIGLLIVNVGYSFYLNSMLSEHIEWHKTQNK